MRVTQISIGGVRWRIDEGEVRMIEDTAVILVSRINLGSSVDQTIPDTLPAQCSEKSGTREHDYPSHTI